MILTRNKHETMTNMTMFQVKRELPCLSNVVLIGDRRKFLSCLVTLKTEVKIYEDKFLLSSHHD